MQWLRERSLFVVVSSALGAIMVLFLIFPILGSLIGSAGGLPGTLADPRTLNAIWTSFYCAFLATILTAILGIPFAYVSARRQFHGKKIIDSLIDLPILIPHNAAGIALLTMLGPSYPIGAALDWMGLRFVDTILGIVVAMTFVSAPFMIRSAQEAFISIDPSMEKVGRSLGANEFKVFIHIILPLSVRGIVTGCLLTWARAVSEFGAVVMLAYFPKTVPVYLYDVFFSQGLSMALPISGLLVIFAIIILVAFRTIVGKPTRQIR